MSLCLFYHLQHFSACKHKIEKKCLHVFIVILKANTISITESNINFALNILIFKKKMTINNFIIFKLLFLFSAGFLCNFVVNGLTAGVTSITEIPGLALTKYVNNQRLCLLYMHTLYSPTDIQYTTFNYYKKIIVHFYKAFI